MARHGNNGNAGFANSSPNPIIETMRILVVEDQPELREVVVEVLRDETYALDSAADGEEGLYKALNWDYDLIILDILMPIWAIPKSASARSLSIPRSAP